MTETENALMSYGLLDDDGYLVPPEHQNVGRLTQKMYNLLEAKHSGRKLSKEDQQSLHLMTIAFDYYNEALDEYLDEEEEEPEEEEEEEDSFIESEYSDDGVDESSDYED